jgi:hypothetical protein
MRDEATTRDCASRQRDQQMEAKRVRNQSSRCQLAQLTGKRDDERHPCTGPIWNIEYREVRECTELILEWAARRWIYGYEGLLNAGRSAPNELQAKAFITASRHLPDDVRDHHRLGPVSGRPFNSPARLVRGARDTDLERTEPTT